MERNRKRLIEIKSDLPRISDAFFKSKQKKTSQFELSLTVLPKQIIQKEDVKLKLVENTIKLIHPANVLKRGYAIIMKEGRVVKSVSQLSNGVDVEIKLKDGIKKSKISE